MDDKEPFLTRWSRRKLATKADAPAGAEAQAEAPSLLAVAPSAPASEPPAAGLSTSATPEYREFFDPQVDETLRRTALKKLFSEPQFNVMDGLDTYIDDYSRSDPIPEAILRRLNQAKELLLFDDEKRESEREGDAAAGVAPAAAGDTAALPGAPAAEVTGELAGAVASAAPVAPPEAMKNA